MTSNSSIEALFIADGINTLTFYNSTGAVVARIGKTRNEWQNVTSLEPLLPPLQYTAGDRTGYWRYNENDVLINLRNGYNISLYPYYEDERPEDPGVDPVDPGDGGEGGAE